MRSGNEWAWAPEFEVKFSRGAKLASGSFRDAYNLRIMQYGDLPVCEYVLKLWNSDAVEARRAELGDVSDSVAGKDLTKRVNWIHHSSDCLFDWRLTLHLF